MRRPIQTSRLLWMLSLVVGLAGGTDADEPYGRHQLQPEARDHWSFQPVERPEIPAVSLPAWSRNAVDRFVLASLESAGLKPAPAAPRATLLRRVYLDLIGLPPTPAELDAFLADSSATALEKVVDDLLSRHQYGERWARHWLDVVRYAETNGYERDSLKPQAWRYRDWVIDAFNADMPYDRFVVEQLAGDELDGSGADAQIATTMLRLGPWDDEPADPLADRYDQLDDIVATTSAAFVGLTLRCARCHDHKFEPFSQRDYTRWQAIFAPLRRPQQGQQDLDREVGPYQEVAAHRQLVKQLNDEKSELEKQVRAKEVAIAAGAVAADGSLAGPADGASAAGGGSGAAERSEPVKQLTKELPHDAIVAFAAEASKRNDQQKKLVIAHAAKLKTLVRELASVEDRNKFGELDRLIEANKSKMPAPMAKAYIWYEDGPSYGPSRLFRRGDPRSEAEEVAPGFPAALVDRPPDPPAPTTHSTGRRLQLARWLTDGKHPLTARVMINRLWQHHFGDGIVATENDFGVMGSAPANQALLDWLASELVDGGWKIKRMHRLMVLSQTYQMASSAGQSGEANDHNEPLLSRFRPRRIEAEALRDTILAVSGQLNSAAGGPGVYPKISRAVLETQSRPGDGWRTSEPAQAARRSVYVFVKRTLLVPELEVLDFPSTEETCEQRVVSTVAPQALTFLNGDFINEQAQAFAQRLVREAGEDDARRVQLAYRLAFSRDPNEKESVAVLAFLARQQAQVAKDSAGAANHEAARLQSLAALCLVLLNTNELAYLQ